MQMNYLITTASFEPTRDKSKEWRLRAPLFTFVYTPVQSI